MDVPALLTLALVLLAPAVAGAGVCPLRTVTAVKWIWDRPRGGLRTTAVWAAAFDVQEC